MAELMICSAAGSDKNCPKCPHSNPHKKDDFTCSHGECRGVKTECITVSEYRKRKELRICSGADRCKETSCNHRTPHERVDVCEMKCSGRPGAVLGASCVTVSEYSAKKEGKTVGMTWDEFGEGAVEFFKGNGASPESALKIVKASVQFLLALTDNLPNRKGTVVVQHIRGGKINAIKLIRQLSGLGLKEAKDITDNVERGTRPELRSFVIPPTIDIGQAERAMRAEGFEYEIA